MSAERQTISQTDDTGSLRNNDISITKMCTNCNKVENIITASPSYKEGIFTTCFMIKCDCGISCRNLQNVCIKKYDAGELLTIVSVFETKILMDNSKFLEKTSPSIVVETTMV